MYVWEIEEPRCPFFFFFFFFFPFLSLFFSSSFFFPLKNVKETCNNRLLYGLARLFYPMDYIIRVIKKKKEKSPLKGTRERVPYRNSRESHERWKKKKRKRNLQLSCAVERHRGNHFSGAIFIYGKRSHDLISGTPSLSLHFWNASNNKT